MTLGFTCDFEVQGARPARSGGSCGSCFEDPNESDAASAMLGHSSSYCKDTVARSLLSLAIDVMGSTTLLTGLLPAAIVCS